MRLNEPSNKPRNKEPMKNRMQTVGAGTKTMMVPSSTRLQMAASTTSAGAADSPDDAAMNIPQQHPLEPSLYKIPGDLYPEYRPLPTTANIFIATASLLSAAISTWRRSTWLHPLRGLKQSPPVREVLSFILKVRSLELFCPSCKWI